MVIYHGVALISTFFITVSLTNDITLTTISDHDVTTSSALLNTEDVNGIAHDKENVKVGNESLEDHKKVLQTEKSGKIERIKHLLSTSSVSVTPQQQLMELAAWAVNQSFSKIDQFSYGSTIESTMPYTSTVKVIPGLSTTPPTSTAEVSPSLLTTPHTSTAEVSLSLSTAPHTNTAEVSPSLSTAPPTSTAEVSPSLSTAPPTSTAEVSPSLSTAPPTSTAEVSLSLSTTPNTSTAEVSPGLSTTPHKGVVEITPNLYNESQKTVTVAIELNKTLPAIATTLSPIRDSTFDRNSTILTSAPSFITWLSTRNFTSSEMSTNETTWTKNVDLVSGTTHSWKLDGANKSLPDSNVLEKDAAKTLRTPTDRSLTTSDEISGVELPSSSRQDVDHYEHPSLTLPPDIIVKTSDYRQVELTTSERPKREVKPIKAAKPTTHSSGMGGLVGGIVGGVSFILIAVIVAVLLIFKMKKNRKKNVEDSSNADETRTIQDVPPKNQWAPDKIAATQFTFKGPLRIPFKQPLIAKHELENEGPPSHHDDVHVQFDDKLNEVYEIGSEVEIIVVDKKKKK